MPHPRSPSDSRKSTTNIAVVLASPLEGALSRSRSRSGPEDAGEAITGSSYESKHADSPNPTQHNLSPSHGEAVRPPLSPAQHGHVSAVVVVGRLLRPEAGQGRPLHHKLGPRLLRQE